MARLTSVRIRRLVLIVLAAILVIPTITVLAIELLAGSERTDIERAVAAAVREATGTEDHATLRGIAGKHEVRLWLVSVDHRSTLFDSDRQPRARSDLGMTSFGMQADLVDRFDDRRVRPADREHALVAAEVGRSAGCATYADDRMLVCEAAARTPAGHVVLAQRAAPRVASRIVDAREGLLVLAGLVLLGGAVLAAWLVRRLTRPLDALAVQVAARTRGERTSIAIADAPREIADVAGAVDRLAGRLEDHNRKQATAAADLAHELKSPLARIRLALDAGNLDAAARTTLDTNARTAITAIDRVVADLLEIARAEAGLRDEPREPVDLYALAKQVIADRPPPASLTVEVTGSPTTASIAPAAITRALGHLLDNAYAHAKSTITVEVSDARLIVRDDGPGVPADLAPRLFDRFASRRPGGTGLGLAYVRAVAEAHGGAATYESRSGTAFTLEVRA